MCRFTLIGVLTLALSACAGIPGRVLLTEDTRDRYVQVRTDWPGGLISCSSGQVDNRPDLKDLQELHGDLDFICSEIQGTENPRIVIESRNKNAYQVVYRRGDRDVLKVIAKALGLEVTQETRDVWALTIREAPGGHRLKAAEKGKQVKVENVCCDTEGRWPLDGVTTDELARFLEIQYRRPVVNLTSLDGRWSILLSRKAARRWPSAHEKVQLDDLGLEMRQEKVKLLVTVVKDRPKKAGK